MKDYARVVSSSHRQAFTLIELLVVITILAILVALLSVSLARAKDKARALQCLNNVRQLGLAHQLYVDEYGLLGIGNVGFADWPPGGWCDLFKPYYGGSTNLGLCPATRDNPAKRAELSVREMGAADMPYSGWYTNRAGQSAYHLGSYGFSFWLYDGKGTPRSNPDLLNFFIIESRVMQPALTPVFADSLEERSTPMPLHRPARDLYTEIFNYESQMAAFTMARHGGRTAHRTLPVPPGQPLHPYVNNIVFFDGHAQPIKLDDLWNLYWHAKWEPPPARPP